MTLNFPESAMLTPPLKTTKEQKNSLIQKLKRAVLPLGLISFGILNGTAGNPVLVLVGVVSGCLALAQPYLDGRRTNPTVKRAFLLMLGSLAFAFLSLTAAPARAQFFQNAETFFTDTFTSSGEAVPIVFNTLRALYIIYLAVAFIGVFNSVRQANERQNVDVAASINAKRSVEAQESLYEGAVPFHTGIVFLVHRNSLEELDDASRQIENS